jgi:hypothetical protein
VLCGGGGEFEVQQVDPPHQPLFQKPVKANLTHYIGRKTDICSK